MLEHNDLQWITPAEIPDYDFCPADVDILKHIQENY
jgi:8-oxo-dGTP diphosphatase